MLALIVASLEKVDERYQSLYEKTSDGKYRLTLDTEVVSTDTLTAANKARNEFRDTNIALLKEKELTTAKFKDVDLEKYADLTSREQDIVNHKLLDTNKVDEIIKTHTQKMADGYAKDLEKLKGTLADSDANGAKLLAHIGELTLTTELTRAVQEVGNVHPAALMDIAARAKKVFALRDMKIVALDENGKQVIGAKGEDYGVPEYIGELRESAPHLFVTPSGGGASGNQGGAGDGKPTGTRLGQYGDAIKNAQQNPGQT